MGGLRAQYFGEIIFTTFQCINGDIPALERHFERLLKGAYFLWGEDIDSCLLEKGFHQKVLGLKSGVYRLELFSRSSELLFGLIKTKELDFSIHRREKRHKSHIKACFSRGRRGKLPGWPKYLKTSFQVPLFHELDMAKKLKCDDVIFLGSDEHIIEASTSNILSYKRGIFYFPMFDEGEGLEGLTTQLIKEKCIKNEARIIEKYLTPKELLSMDHIWFCNCVQGAVSVSSITDPLNDKKIKYKEVKIESLLS